VRFHRPHDGLVHHHSGIAGYSQFSVVARESIVKIDRDLPMENRRAFWCAHHDGCRRRREYCRGLLREHRSRFSGSAVLD
jgi:Zn-dependent alcohol dehydrogenase